MRKTVILLSFFLLAANVSGYADEAETIAAINAASAALDDAFERQSADDIKRMVTPDHVAVTPYYDGPQSVEEQIESLPDLNYEQTLEGEVKVTVLGPDAGLRTFVAKFDGTFRGKPIPSRGFVTSVMVRKQDRWLEQFYQVTELKP